MEDLPLTQVGRGRRGGAIRSLMVMMLRTVVTGSRCEKVDMSVDIAPPREPVVGRGRDGEGEAREIGPTGQVVRGRLRTTLGSMVMVQLLARQARHRLDRA